MQAVRRNGAHVPHWNTSDVIWWELQASAVRVGVLGNDPYAGWRRERVQWVQRSYARDVVSIQRPVPGVARRD